MSFTIQPQPKFVPARALGIATLAFALLTAACSLSAQAGPARPLATQAELRHLIEQGHADQALQQLDRQSQAAPVASGVNRLRGIALYAQGKLQPADQAFAAALVDDPADHEARQMRGITLFRLGRPADAIPLLEAGRQTKVQTTTQTPVDPSYVLALCYLDTRRYDDARAAFASQFGFPPGSASAYLLAARMMLRREYLPVAQQFARKALELAPGIPRAHLLLGEAQLAGNHFEEAIRELTAERTLNPLEPSTYDRLGDAYVRQGDLTQARLSLQEAILLEPNSTGPFILLGKVLIKQGDDAGAITYLEHASVMDQSNYMTHSLLGQAYRQMGRVDDARRETDTAQKLQAAEEPTARTP